MKTILSFGFLLTTLAAHSADWPQWRGPLATGVAPEANPPLRWSETEHVKWKVKIPGVGSATPIIWKDQVFVITAIPAEAPAAKAAATPALEAPKPPPRVGVAAVPVVEAGVLEAVSNRRRRSVL
jgi:hypothetical protein